MKIAIVTETFLPSTDGIVTRLCATIKWLQNNGHKVLVIAPDLGVREYSGAEVKGAPAQTLWFYPDRKFSLPSRKVRKYLKEFQPDILHVVNPILLGVSGIYAAWRLRLPLIASYHTNVPQYTNYYNLSMFESLIWWYVRILHNRASLNLCTSQSVQQELREKGFRNVQVWKRGVAVERFGPQNYDREMRERLSNGQPEKKLLLYVGRLAVEKEIEKVRAILETAPDFCLALVGDGPHRQVLERHFQGTRTVFTGFLGGLELAKAYASADIFVFPSTTETLGLVILEALASGLPVVAAQSGPTSEQVAHNITGLLYDSQDGEGFTEAVLRLRDETLRRELAGNAYSTASKLSWDEPSEQLASFYRQVCRKKSLHCFDLEKNPL